MPGLAVFWGCRVLSGDVALELSVRKVLETLGVDITDLEPQSCCGEPIRSLNLTASCYLALRILALSASKGYNEVLMPCSKGYFMANWSLDMLSRSGELSEAISKAFSSEGLSLDRLSRPIDLVELVYRAVGPEGLRNKVEKPLGLRVALHPGCYFMRSKPGTGEGLRKLAELRELLSAVGVEAPYYPGMMDCCGGSLWLTRQDAALTLAGSKLKAASESSLDCLVVLCPSCFEMLDARQEDALSAVGEKKGVPVLYLPQLLGLALGIDPAELGLRFNRSPVEELSVVR